jgi:GNAT superfamily N-acetyltransferase
MPYQIQVGSQVVEFPDSVGQDEAQRILSEQFPATGEDIAGAMQDPAYKPSVDDYLKFEEFSKNKQTDWVNTIAQSVDAAAGMISGAVSQGAQGAVANPLNYIEGAAQGTRQLYGLVAQSQDPASPLFKFKDLVAGTGTPESRYNQFLEARDFANTTARLERGEEGIVVPPEYTNPEFVQGVSMILDPTLALPGIGEVLGAGKLATRAVGKGTQLTGRAVAGAARPLERVAGAAERMTAEALGMAPEALRNTAATAGIAGALGIAPEAAAFAAIPAGIRTAREAGEALTRAGENLMTQPSRIGPLEAIGAAPGANLRQRMLGVVGQYGGDAALDASLRGIAGGIEGAAVGTLLGGLSGGEEGAAAGLGSGLAQGAAGALGARGFERLTGKAAKEARAGDLGRFIDAQQDPTTKTLFERVRDQHGVDAASALMDLQGLVRGKFGDVDILYRSNAQMAEKFGDNIRGVQFEQAERPTIFINADIIGKGTGDGPLYTLGHELFHALEKTTQLEGGATEIKDALVGRWIQEGDTIRKLAEGAFNDAEIEARFNEYRDKLAAGNQQRADQLAQFDTIDKKAGYVASELAAEHFAGLLAGQKPDALLKGFTGVTRQLLDAALTQNTSRALADAAATIERTFGVKPTDSVLFPDLKQASPQVNAMLRDLLRARRKLDERITIENEGPGKVLKPQDVSNPIAAKQLVDLGVAEKMPDGSVRNLSDEEIRVREEKDTAAIRTILESVPGARVVDGEILGRFSPQQLSAIEQSQAVSSRMKDKIRAVNAAMDAGNSLFLNYGAATRRVKNRLTGKFTSKYNSGIRISQREVLPYSFYLSKADNPVIKAIDISKIRGALDKLTAPDGGVAAGLWDNIDGFMSDLAAYFTNLDAGEGARRSAEIFGLEKAKFLGDFVNEQEKGGRKFVRDFRLDRIGSTAPMDFRARISEDAIQKSKMRWMPAETVGDKSVINSEEGYRIISGAKHRLYGPDGKLIGIYDTQTQAERKADATQARLQPEVRQQQYPARDEVRQTAEAGGRNRNVGGQEGQGQGGAVRQAGDVGARFMAASEADPSQPSTQAIRSVKGQRAVNSLYQFDYTYKTKTPGKPAREKTATETISAFSISEAKEKAKAAIMKDLTDDPTVLRSTISISQPEIKGQFAVTELTGKPADPKSPKIVLNPGTPEKFKSMFNAVDAALDLVKDSPALGLDSDGWIKAYSRALNGSRASVPPAPLRLAQWVQDNGAFRKFIEDGLQRNPELVKSAVGGLNALQPIHELARQGQIPSKMVALHMFWGLLSRMLDPYNQEAGWARLTSEPKVLRLIEDSVEGRYKFTKDQWKEIVSTKMSEFPDVSVGRNAIQNANAFHEMLSRWNGRWDELTGIINNPDLTGPQMRRQFNEKGFGGAGIKHKVLSFVLATLARNDVFVGDRWQVVNLWFQHLEKAAAARKAQGGSPEVFAYDRNGVPEDTTGAYKVIGGMLNNETVAETAYSLIENGMRKIAAESPWLREMLGREPQPFDIHWLTWNIIKNEPVGHSSLDATAKFLTENLYGDPEFAQKFAETEKRTEKYAKGVFDVFSVKGQERPQIRQRPGADDGGTGAAGLGPDAGRGPGRPSGQRTGTERYQPGGEPVEQGRGDRGGRDSFRNLAPLAGSPSVPGFNGPDSRIVAVADQYARENGIELKRQAEYVQVDEARARRIADAYDAMAHAPEDPAVKAAYEDLIRQTVGQYEALAKSGYKFWFIDTRIPSNAEYASSPWNALRDMRSNQQMGVFPTTDGFGSSEVDVSKNPLLAETGIKWPVGGVDGPLRTVLANDLFRAVHDAFGHGIEGSGFRAQGEENAWQAHIRLFTGPARGAITTETRGQNSWLNYGPYGERNRTAKTEDTVFADQKTGLMPEWTWTEGRAADEATTSQGEVGAQRYMPAGEAGQGAPKRYETVDSFREHWNSLGVRNMTDIRGRGTPYEHIRPSEIEVEKANRNKGLGTAFMQDLTEFADSKGLQIRVNPSDELGATSKGRLEKFYKRFGFVENKPGKNKDYAISERFYRPASQGQRYMPSPDSAMPGAYSFQGGYRAIPGKTKGSFRLYGPAGSLIGIASSLDEAQRILRRKTK